MPLGNQDEKVKGWVSRALDLLESEKPAFYQAALPMVEEIWAAHPELKEKFGTASDYLKRVAEEAMLSTVGLLPNAQPATPIHDVIKTLSNSEIPLTGGFYYEMTKFSEAAGNYFYRGKRHEFIDADKAELTTKFKVGANDSGMGIGKPPKTENS
jgi:hypothetical protein